MEIFNLSTVTGLSKPTAISYSPKDNKDKLYYRLVHGSIGKNLHAYTLPISFNIGRPTSKGETLLLDGKDYELAVNTKEDGEYLKDSIGNIRYRLIKKPLQNITDYRYILLVSLPILEPNSVRVWTYTNNGNVRANARQGYNRDNGTYSGISPIIEVNCDNSITDFYLTYITYTPGNYNATIYTVIVNPFKSDSFTVVEETKVDIRDYDKYSKTVEEYVNMLLTTYKLKEIEYLSKLITCFTTLHNKYKGDING